MKRIGIISDTHAYWDDKFEHYFESCDEIWHAGDIGSVEVAERMPVISVALRWPNDWLLSVLSGRSAATATVATCV